MNHVLEETKRDDYISRDFYNVQQTAGGSPEGVSFDGYLAAITGHVRDELMSGSFDEVLGDEDQPSEGVLLRAGEDGGRVHQSSSPDAASARSVRAGHRRSRAT
jgi:hypothetical protein